MTKSSKLRVILSENIKVHRAKLGISQEALAEMCGLHRTYIGSVERSERNVSLNTLETLASALNTTVPLLLTPRSRKD